MIIDILTEHSVFVTGVW